MLKGRQNASTSSQKSTKTVKPSKSTRRSTFSIISLFASDRNKKSGKRGMPSRPPAYVNDEEGSIATSAALFEPGQSTAATDVKVDVALANSNVKGKSRECPLCFEEQPQENFFTLMTCTHRSCTSCLRQYLKIEIAESRVSISCPECSEKLHPSDIKRLLRNDALMDKWEKFMLRRVLVTDPDARWCPAPDCGYAVIASGCAGCPKLHCQRVGCNTLFCYHCKQEWHPSQTCDAARQQRTSHFRAVLSSLSGDVLLPTGRDEIKPCPRCKSYITKMDDGSCNHMTCALCGAQFCWLCNKEITDLHYLSPSGCTFWGKKPWSRKKKILWQLGTLLGAPLGIALIAGLAVPVIVVAFPIYAGKWLYQRHKNKSSARRSVIIAAGAFGAFLLSPVVAALAVAIGVPVMLTYVYGVVPISLCRGGNGGSGESPAAAPGSTSVRFDFDEDAAAESTHASIANPSIAPSIGEASLWAANSYSASSTNIDRAGLRGGDGGEQSDVESNSHKAIAGQSLSGSFCDAESAAAARHSFSRLEIHADIAPRHVHRNSFSSESANASVGDSKSVAMSTATGDSVSVKALAGSLSALRDRDGYPFALADMTVDSSLSAGEEAKMRSIVEQASSSSSDCLKSKCRSASHGSPISNRSVTFATMAVDEVAIARHVSLKLMKRRDKSCEPSPSEKAIAAGCSTASGSSASADALLQRKLCDYRAGGDNGSMTTRTIVCSSQGCSVASCLAALPHTSSQGVDSLAGGGDSESRAAGIPAGHALSQGSGELMQSTRASADCIEASTDANAVAVVHKAALVNGMTVCAAYHAADDELVTLNMVENGRGHDSLRLRRRVSCELAMENGLQVDAV